MVKGRVFPPVVVEFEIVGRAVRVFGHFPVSPTVHVFVLDGLSQAFDEDIVVCAPFRIDRQPSRDVYNVSKYIGKLFVSLFAKLFFEKSGEDVKAKIPQRIKRR